MKTIHDFCCGLLCRLNRTGYRHFVNKIISRLEESKSIKRGFYTSITFSFQSASKRYKILYMKMNFAKRFTIQCVVLSMVMCAALCSVESNNLQEGEACLVQYLQAKEKLSKNFETDLPASSQCRLVTPFTMQIIRITADELIKKDAPNAADCLTKEFGDKEAIDYVVKISVIDASRSLSESERATQLETTRNEFKQELEKIASHCHTDDKNFIKLFSDNLGMKNGSLAVAQYEYCLAKYAVDHKVLELGNVEMNPQQIDEDGVDCDHIIDLDKRKNEKMLTDKASATSQGSGSTSCVIDSYRSLKIYDWAVALKVINNLDFSRETKKVEANRITEKIATFALSIFACLGNVI